MCVVAPIWSLRRSGRRGVLTPTGYEAWCVCGIVRKCITELRLHFSLFSDGQASVHQQQYREHQQGQHRWPLQQEAQQDQDKCHVLGMADAGVRPCGGKGVSALGVVEHIPGRRQQVKADTQEK